MNYIDWFMAPVPADVLITNLGGGCSPARVNRPSKLRLGNLLKQTVGLSITLLAICGVVSGAAAQGLNPQIKVGIVQRFGEKLNDTLTVAATPGDQLTVTFPDQGQWKTLTTNQVVFEIKPQPLETPEVEERLVLSTHRSFESAETRAQQFQALGIAVEIAQPHRWQVWAHRDRYTSETQAQLLAGLKARGYKTVYLDRITRSVNPQLSWVANGYRYHRDVTVLQSSNSLFEVNRNRYGGRLRFQPNTYGTYTLVNQVPIETYLRGVVPYEIGPQAPETAVQAQAIIARTYALRNLRRFRIDDYELCADTQCQVYKGLSGSIPWVDRAIAATAGQVLTYKNELVDALYFSTAGGITAPFEDVWEGEARPYLKAVIDAVPNQVWDLSRYSLAPEPAFREFIQRKQGFNEETWNYFRWNTETPLPALNTSVRKFLKQQQHPLANFQTIQKLEVVERANSGRVQRLRVTTDQGAVDFTKDEILLAFDAPNSLLFYVEPRYADAPAAPSALAPSQTVPNESMETDSANPPASLENAQQPAGQVATPQPVLKGYAFIGGGLGHGVGLSQAGSYRLSRLGWSAEQILNFYYPGAQLGPLTKSTVYWPEPVAAPVDPTTSILPTAPKQNAEESWSLFGFKLPKCNLAAHFKWLPFI